MPYKDLEQQRRYMREWTAKRRAAYFKNKSCVKCGSVDRLELDHIDRNTKVSHNIWSWSQEKFDTEIIKCQVLCYVCHKIKTRSEVAKLSVEETAEIRTSPSSERRLASMYGVSRSTVRSIKGRI